jgi:hypothetical protein
MSRSMYELRVSSLARTHQGPLAFMIQINHQRWIDVPALTDPGLELV